MTGYLDAAYARSLDAWGRPMLLPRSQGWILAREIPGAPGRDAIGPYPVFACRDWEALAADIAGLADLVTFTLVTDPFADTDETRLAAAFPDRCARFKDHHVVDLAAPRVSSHHRRNAEQAQGRMQVRLVEDPRPLLDAWWGLYEVLIERHDITGPQRFSRAIFERQLATPGARAVIAERDGEIIGMTLWFEQEDRAYYHLGAYSPLGYELKASFALFAAAIEVFRDRVPWLVLGAGAGLADAEDGLTRFKRGWSSGVRPTYLCGVVLDRERYSALEASCPPTAYFPAYRAGEFG